MSCKNAVLKIQLFNCGASFKTTAIFHQINSIIGHIDFVDVSPVGRIDQLEGLYLKLFFLAGGRFSDRMSDLVFSH